MDTGYRLSDIFLFNRYNRDFLDEWQIRELDRACPAKLREA